MSKQSVFNVYKYFVQHHPMKLWFMLLLCFTAGLGFFYFVLPEQYMGIRGMISGFVGYVVHSGIIIGMSNWPRWKYVVFSSMIGLLLCFVLHWCF